MILHLFSAVCGWHQGNPSTPTKQARLASLRMWRVLAFPQGGTGLANSKLCSWRAWSSSQEGTLHVSAVIFLCALRSFLVCLPHMGWAARLPTLECQLEFATHGGTPLHLEAPARLNRPTAVDFVIRYFGIFCWARTWLSRL